MARRSISEALEEVITGREFANGPRGYKRSARRDYNWL